MSTIIMAACWPLQGMSPAQKAVLISLADQASDDGVCWPAVGTIAKRTCLSERAVRDALAWLQASGVVFREYRPNTSTSYTISPKRYDPSKAPTGSKRATNRKKEVPADAASPANATPLADAASPANAAPLADAAAPANAASPGADAASHPANAAPLGGQMPPPNHQLNHQLTVNEPPPPASQSVEKVKAIPVDEQETELQAACKATWKAYSDAYLRRYKAKPVRNATVNTKVKNFVKRLGYEESPAVAEFYVDRVSERLVVQRMHDVGLLLSGAEGYRTQWIAGTAMTETRAKQADQSQSNFDAADEAMAIIRANREKEGANA